MVYREAYHYHLGRSTQVYHVYTVKHIISIWVVLNMCITGIREGYHYHLGRSRHVYHAYTVEHMNIIWVVLNRYIMGICEIYN